MYQAILTLCRAFFVASDLRPSENQASIFSNTFEKPKVTFLSKETLTEWFSFVESHYD